ncbi:hypothetical protein ISS22_07355 [candidate division KSB1 bacterium]|nr:hypothetical protein [candidate division KSB1 bacterium]
MKKKLISFLLSSTMFVCFISTAFADKTASIFFSENDLTYSQKEGYDIISLKEPTYLTSVGEPKLPTKVIQFLIPNNVKVRNVRIISIQEKQIKGEFNIYPAQHPQPVQVKRIEQEFVPQKPTIYKSNSLYPENIIEILDHGFSFGYHLVALQVRPLRYLPAKKKLFILTDITFSLEYESTEEPFERVERRSKKTQKMIDNLIKSMVENKKDLDISVDKLLKLEAPQLETKQFSVSDFPSVLSDIVEYVIITEEPLVFEFQRLVEWKTQKGVPIIVKTVSWIKTNYPGVDTQEKIRNFIKDANSKWGTNYILLGGDVNIVPARYGFYDSHEGNYGPTDLYYSGLNGNWNADGDHIFGEDNDAFDYSPDLWIGRAPVETINEANVFVEKVLMYEKDPDLSYINDFLFMGSHVLKTGVKDYWGQDVKNDISDLPCIPTYTHITKLFVDHNSCRGDEELNKENAIAYLNQGYHLVNHADHSGYTAMGTGSFFGGGELNNVDMENLNNHEKLSILFTLGCSPNAYDFESITESFINNQYGGGVAVIGNSRTGYSTQKYQDFKFFATLFNSNNPKLGITFASIQGPLFSTSYHFKYSPSRNMNLLGDPEMPIWTDTPQNLDVSHPSTISNGENLFTVSISNFLPDQEALVCLQKDKEDYAYGETINGSITFLFIPDTPGNLNVTVTAHNFLPYEDQVPIDLTNLAHLYCIENTIDDDTIDGSNGNGDGIINTGETVEMSVTLKNGGSADADGVSATLNTSFSFITIINNYSAFGDIPPNELSTSVSDFVFIVDKDCQDDTSAILELNIEGSNGNTWNDEIFIEIKAPNLEHTAHTINDIVGGNGNGIIENGESIILDMTVTNFGSGAASVISANLSTTANNVQIVNGGTAIGDLPANSTITKSNAFEFSVTGEWVGIELFYLEFMDSYGKKWTHNFELTPPSKPLNVSYFACPDKIELCWSKNPESDIAGYNIYRSITEAGPYIKRNFYLIKTATYYSDIDILPDIVYYYRITAQDGSANESAFFDFIRISIRPHTGWPVTVGGEMVSSPMLYDINNDDLQEIFTSAFTGKDYAFFPDGTELLDMDNDPNTVSGIASREEGGMWATPAIGDIDNDGEIEMISTTYYDKHEVYAWELYDGTDVDFAADAVSGNWPIDDLEVGIVASPVLFDLDHDGDLEVILVTHSGKLSVWHHNGIPDS